MFTSSVPSAIEREKRLKTWKRIWKIRLIEEANPEWKDLYCDFAGGVSNTSASGHKEE